MKQLSSLASRVLFSAAFVLAGCAVLEKLANLMGYTLIFLGGYTASRLLNFAAISLLFVIALQLRELRHSSQGPGSPR